MNLANIRWRMKFSYEIAPTPRDNVRQLKEILRPRKWKQGPRIPPEVRSVVAIARAAAEGDEELVWRLIGADLGHEPDAHLKTLLRPEFEGTWRHWSIPAVRSALRAHRDRLAGVRTRTDRKKEAKELLDSWRKYGELRRALAQYAGEDQLVEVLRALLDAEARLPPGETLTSSKVDYRVKYDNRPSHVSVDSPRGGRYDDSEDEDAAVLKHNNALWHTAAPREEQSIKLASGVAPLDALPALNKFVGDPDAVTNYLGVENTLYVRQLIRDAGLNDEELLVLKLRRQGLASKAIGYRLGCTEEAVNTRVSRIYGKLRAVS